VKRSEGVLSRQEAARLFRRVRAELYSQLVDHPGGHGARQAIARAALVYIEVAIRDFGICSGALPYRQWAAIANRRSRGKRVKPGSIRPIFSDLRHHDPPATAEFSDEQGKVAVSVTFYTTGPESLQEAAGKPREDSDGEVLAGMVVKFTRGKQSLAVESRSSRGRKHPLEVRAERAMEREADRDVVERSAARFVAHLVEMGKLSLASSIKRVLSREGYRPRYLVWVAAALLFATAAGAGYVLWRAYVRRQPRVDPQRQRLLAPPPDRSGVFIRSWPNWSSHHEGIIEKYQTGPSSYHYVLVVTKLASELAKANVTWVWVFTADGVKEVKRTVRPEVDYTPTTVSANGWTIGVRPSWGFDPGTEIVINNDLSLVSVDKDTGEALHQPAREVETILETDAGTQRLGVSLVPSANPDEARIRLDLLDQSGVTPPLRYVFNSTTAPSAIGFTPLPGGLKALQVVVVAEPGLVDGAQVAIDFGDGSPLTPMEPVLASTISNLPVTYQSFRAFAATHVFPKVSKYEVVAYAVSGKERREVVGTYLTLMSRD